MSWSSSSGVQYSYSSSLVYVDLSNDFTPSSTSISSIAKPHGAPNAWLSGIWTNDGLLYTGFAGREPPFGDMANPNQGLWSFEPSADGTDGTWTNLNGTADAYFTTSLRPFAGSIASGGGNGFFLGGQVDYSANDTYQPTSGLVTYDFATHTVDNASVAGVSTDGWAAYGQMHYVPNFGPAGVVVSAGGIVADDKTTYGSFETVQVLDQATGTWYEQATTGDAPAERKEFCMAGAASSNDTYEVVVYAGWGGTLGDDSIPYDDLYVLSLPSFHWFRASYEALHPRHGLTCEHVGGGQVLAIGGVDTTQQIGSAGDTLFKGCFQTVDEHAQGLRVFDLGTMAWADGYVRNQTVYDQSSAVRGYYEENDRMADFTSSALKQVFSVQNFTAAATAVGSSSADGSSASASSSATSTAGGSGGGATSSSSSSSAGPIAGGVVGGVALAAAVVGAVFYFLRRRERQRKLGAAIRQQGSTHPGDAFKTPYVEMQGHEPHAETQGQNLKYHRPELPNDTAHEMDTQSHRIELP